MRGLTAGKLEREIARLRELDREADGILFFAHEDERFALDLESALAPRKLLGHMGIAHRALADGVSNRILCGHAAIFSRPRPSPLLRGKETRSRKPHARISPDPQRPSCDRHFWRSAPPLQTTRAASRLPRVRFP